jgi:hypothetical protein
MTDFLFRPWEIGFNRFDRLQAEHNRLRYQCLLWQQWLLYFQPQDSALVTRKNS